MEKINAEENQRSDHSEPNINDNANAEKLRKMMERGHQAKNLEAERKRRRKLNDKLYSLRALVPKISKLDRAAILDDAISYVEELQKQADDLQTELQQRSDDEADSDGTRNSKAPVALHQTVTKTADNHDAENKVQQMEPQVEVVEIKGKEYFVKILCEDKGGSFVGLVEALNSLDMQVLSVNAAKHRFLVSTIFIVQLQRKDSEIVEADRLKETLMELVKRIDWNSRKQQNNGNNVA